MATQAFDPKFMKVGVLTAALQELTPREERDPDPDLAIEEWVAFARELGADYIQLSAALHPTETDIPPEAMLDPVANTLDLRQPFDKERAARVAALPANQGRPLRRRLFRQPAAPRSGDPEEEARFHAAHVRRGGVARRRRRLRLRRPQSAAQHGREPGRLRAVVHPAAEGSESRGLTYRVEQCPMPGWTTGDNFHNNIAYTPGTWIALHRICEKHGVGDQFRIHYDPSHAILMGQDTRSIFQYLKDKGYNFLIGGFHVKGQVIDAKGGSAWGYGGQTVERGDWIDGKPSPNPADQVNAWKKQVVLGRARAAGHGEARSAGVSAEPDGRLARSSARRARAAEAGRRQHAPDRRARISESANPGQGAAQADPARVDRVRPPHRRGGGVHVRAAARGAGGAGDSGAGRRPAGLQELTGDRSNLNRRTRGPPRLR